ncbi:sulfatase family protein [Wenyingzhuangia aestuarii]|uniref:sulfatase family protein n=1 Tax=Wenyingzhuangia aestuarii TaxID=1647582 RepID=UPI00143A65ED|nr:sulfatase [Wenyingzhuangia aestuarii]NJB83544.1 putative sulfatase [Wenyingzhuangia aestuarii]
MIKRNLLYVVQLCMMIGFTGVKSYAQQTKKTNVIWIITDEHNFRTLSCYRDQLTPEQALQWGKDAVIKTPNIDALAENGTIFNRMYCSAAVCTASRASMFTGMYPMTLGIPNNSNKKGDGKYLKPDVTTIADVLTGAGYMTGYSGKWHLAESRSADGNKDHDEWWSPYPTGVPSDNYGFQDKRFMFNGGHDKFKGMDANGNPYYAAKNPKLLGKDKYGQPIYQDKKSKNVKFTTDWLGDRAVEFIADNKNKPFFYVVSIPDPHTPDIARTPYDTLYNNIKVELPKTYKYAFENKAKLPKWQSPDNKTNDEEKLKKSIQQYLGMVKIVDENVGRIIQKLKDEGIFENTIVMFSSDHGDLLGEHGRVNKGTIHEASAKIPFVLAQGQNNKNPLIPRKKVVNLAANNTDWMPTFLSLLDIDCPKVAGRDITPLFQNKLPANWDDVTFSRLGYYAAITSRYKLSVMYSGKPWLFDIEADPDELVNFIDDKKYEKVIVKLAKDLNKYMDLAKDDNKKIKEQVNKLIQKNS